MCAGTGLQGQSGKHPIEKDGGRALASQLGPGFKGRTRNVMRRSGTHSQNHDKRRGRELVRLRIELLEDRAPPTAGPTLAVDNTPLPSSAPLISAGPASASVFSSVQQVDHGEKQPRRARGCEHSR